jgi:S1-C subfamily serine protease
VLGHDFESGLGLLRLDGAGPYPAAAIGRSDAIGPRQPVSVVGMGEDRRLVGRAATVTAVRRFVAYWEYMLDRAILVAPQHPAFGGAAVVDAGGALVGLASLRLERKGPMAGAPSPLGWRCRVESRAEVVAAATPRADRETRNLGGEIWSFRPRQQQPKLAGELGQCFMKEHSSPSLSRRPNGWALSCAPP